MPKLRKQRRKKVYRHNVNRKRLRNKILNTGSVNCHDLKKAWDEKKSVQTNMAEMGLSYDPNLTLGIPRKKRQLQEAMSDNKEERPEDVHVPPRRFVAESLEADAKAPREKRLRLPKSQVEWLTYLLKKYGSDYKAMARDSRNYHQETWKQLRQKVRTFRTIPEQYGKYLTEDGARPVDMEADQLTDDEI